MVYTPAPVTEPYSLIHITVDSMWVIASTTCFLYLLHPGCLLPEELRLFFEPNPFTYYIPLSQPHSQLKTYSPMNMEETGCSETLAFKLYTPGNNTEESIRLSSSCLGVSDFMVNSWQQLEFRGFWIKIRLLNLILDYEPPSPKAFRNNCNLLCYITWVTDGINEWTINSMLVVLLWSE
jgi:hypothetical protein